MPRRENGSFVCEVCGCPYNQANDAEECERQTKPPVKFKIRQKVTYRTVAIEFETRILSHTLAFTRIGDQKLATHTWFYEIQYPQMGKILTPETLLSA